jgi:hypothetical protein
MTPALPIVTSSNSAVVEGRRSHRKLVSVPATISSSGSSFEVCEIRDINRHGCRLKLEFDIAVSSKAILLMHADIRSDGTVMWVFAGEAGLKFDKELSNEAVEEITKLK